MPQHKIAIVTDSTCDIPKALIEEYSLFVQAHILIWGTQQYRDRVEISPEEFYRRLETEKELPTTSQATAQDFAAMYRRAAETGADEIVAIIVSGALSGALQSAQMGAENAPVPVHVYNSRSVSMGMGWQVLAAARAREAGGGVAEMLQAADEVRRRILLYIYLNTMEYLYRGGRIGNARRLLGKALNIKPLIYINQEQGIVEPAGMAVTRRRGMETLYNRFFSLLGNDRPQRIMVLHGNVPDDAAAFCERVQREYAPEELLSNITGPAIGINTGPGAIALCGYSGA